MNKKSILVVVFFTALNSFALDPIQPTAEQVPNPLDRKNAVSAEIGGRSFSFGTVNYDRMLADWVAVGIGVGRMLGWGAADFTIVPVYGNFYIPGEKHRLYGTAGFNTHFRATTDLMSHLGIGYEFRGAEGFLLRLTVYALGLETAGGIPWGGLTLGYTF